LGILSPSAAKLQLPAWFPIPGEKRRISAADFSNEPVEKVTFKKSFSLPDQK